MGVERHCQSNYCSVSPLCGQSMTSEQFVYWLQGYFELLPEGVGVEENSGLDEGQVEIIKAHLALVLHNVTRVTVPEVTSAPNPPWTPPSIVTCQNTNGHIC
jgi:hypothetical protein